MTSDQTVTDMPKAILNKDFKMGTEIYHGERIYLRELTAADVTESYLAWFRDEDVTEFLDARNLTRQEVLNYIQLGKETKVHYLYAICVKENDRHIGNLKIGPIDRAHMKSDAVLVIGDKEYWGKGLATEAIKIGNKIAFEVHNLRKLTGGMHSGNIASIKAYTKAEWIVEGILAGHYVINGEVMDRVCVSCFNPKYFDVSGNYVKPIL